MNIGLFEDEMVLSPAFLKELNDFKALVQSNLRTLAEIFELMLVGFLFLVLRYVEPSLFYCYCIYGLHLNLYWH